MSGRIVFQPKNPTTCDIGQCEGRPRPESYHAGTIWQCDVCGRQWIVWWRAKCNETFAAWKLHRESTDSTNGATS